MTGELQVRLLGRPQLTYGGAPLRGLALRKSLALVAYLAVTGRAHTREALANLLWPETIEPNARAALRKTLADLRQAVPTHIIVSRDDVAFDGASPYGLDVAAFERSIVQTVTLPGPLTAEGAAALEEAVGLYRGGFMEGFSVRKAPDFEEWMLWERHHLLLLVLRACHALLEYYATQGEHELALHAADRLLALEPAHEEAHRHKMRLLWASGRRSAALRQYRDCRRALHELDIELGRETTELYEQIRTDSRGVGQSDFLGGAE